MNSSRLANVLQMIDPNLTYLDGAIRIALPLQDASRDVVQPPVFVTAALKRK